MTPAGDRRRSARVPVDGSPLAEARIVGGGDVQVVNLSMHGAALRGRERARPGRPVGLFWTLAGKRVRVSARVVRASVSALRGEGGVEYAAGLEFAEPVDALWELITREG